MLLPGCQWTKEPPSAGFRGQCGGGLAANKESKWRENTSWRRRTPRETRSHVKYGSGVHSCRCFSFLLLFFCLCAPCHHPRMSVCGSAHSCLGQRCVFLHFNEATTLLFYRSWSGVEQRRLAASKTQAPCETITTTGVYSLLPSGRTLLHDAAFVTFFTLSFLPVKPQQFLVCACALN